MPSRHAVRRRPVLALQIPPLHGRAARVRARGRHRGVRRRPRQLPVPALGLRHVAAARVRERQAGGHAEPPDDRLRRAEGRRPVFVAGHPGSTDRQLTVAELEGVAQPPAAAGAAARLRAARPLHPVREDGRRRRAHRARRAVRPGKHDQGAAPRARRAARRRPARGEACRGSRPAPTDAAQCGAGRGRPLGADRGRANRGATALAAVRVHRKRQGLQQPTVSLRSRARARRRRAPETEHATAARVCRRLVAANRAADRRTAADLSRARTAHVVVRARAHARVARPRRYGRAAIADGRHPRFARGAPRRRLEAGRSQPCGSRCGKAVRRRSTRATIR